MKSGRLEQLADGIFAIVMTILVFDIRIPVNIFTLTNAGLWHEIVALQPHLFGFILSFTLLFTYWRAHHFFISVYAKNLDSRLTNINTLFFLLIALIPFSTSILSRFPDLFLSIALFGVHIILLGLCIYWMRNYVLYSEHIKNPEISKREIHGSTIRTLFPVFISIVAIYIALFNTTYSLTLFTIAVIFNLSSYSTILLEKVLRIFKTQRLKED
ncbi:MAG: TMEM175 family protein [bacterium]|nr:TMEM175 family protein [bacterium]